METALLLIVLGFGYKIYADASANAKNRTKRLGKVVGVIMMIAGLAGAACKTACKISCYTGMNPFSCNSMKGSHPYGMYGKMGKFKGMCPLMGKSSGTDASLPEIPSADFAQKSIKEELK